MANLAKKVENVEKFQNKRNNGGNNRGGRGGRNGGRGGFSNGGEEVATTTIGTIGSTHMGIRKKSLMQIVTIVVVMAIGLGHATSLVGFVMTLPIMSRGVLGTL